MLEANRGGDGGGNNNHSNPKQTTGEDEEEEKEDDGAGLLTEMMRMESSALDMSLGLDNRCTCSSLYLSHTHSLIKLF